MVKIRQLIKLNNTNILIDCEGGFDIKRFQEVLEETIKQRIKMTKKDLDEIVQTSLQRLLYLRILDNIEMQQLMNKIKRIIKEGPQAI